MSTWKTTSTKVIYESKWLKLLHDEVVLPDNHTAQYDIVERRDVVLIIPKANEHFYMVSQFRYPIRQESLEFPQGFCEAGESKEDAATRELGEETGLVADKLLHLGSLWVSAGFLRQRIHVFLAENFTIGSQKLDATEIGLTVQKVSLSGMQAFITDATISNGPTVAALGLYFLSNAA